MPDRDDDNTLWSRQWGLFHAALERPENERQAFLAEACPDAQLRRTLEELLAVDECPFDLLDKPLSVVLGHEDAVQAESAQLPDTTETLPTGHVLGQRFEIVQLLGEGGMGAVYEARDSVLDTSVALKMLRPEVAASAEQRKRFHREIQMARQVTHPNICRVFDLFQDGELSFLTMELLEGETLRDRIQDRGPMATTGALPLVKQICEGLAAAHAANIIHRDLKSANIMLVGDGDSSRAVVTDFGLARMPGSEAVGRTPATGDRRVLGTPAYMAPEQLEGAEISTATDVYALGVVLFEMATGRLPFEADTTYSLVARRLREQAVSPREYVKDLDPLWERSILLCLARDPRDRPSVEEIPTSLQGGVALHSPRASRYARRAVLLSAGVLLATLVFTVGTGLVPRLPSFAVQALSFAEHDWLLIADFDNRTNEKLFDGTLEAALERDLVNSDFINVASEARVNDSLILMDLSPETQVDAALAREVALRDGGIRTVVGGRIEKLGSTYLLGVDLIDPTDGAVLASLSKEAVGHEEILPAVQDLSMQVRKALGEVLPTLDRSEPALKRVSTPSLRALQLYSRADQLFIEEEMGGGGRSRAAEELLKAAIAADPEFASAHVHLAWALERQNKAAEDYMPHAERAFELADEATVVERYFIRGSYYTLLARSSRRKEDLETAIANYQALLELAPNHFWAITNVTNLLNDLGRGWEVLPLALRLVEARPNDVETLEKAARHLVEIEGDLDRARELVGRALELKAELPERMARPTPFLLFFPLHELWIQGQVHEVNQELDRIVASLDSLGGMDSVALARTAADFYLDLGRLTSADDLQALYGFSGPQQWEWMLALRRGNRQVVKELTLWRAEWSEVTIVPELAMDLLKVGYPSEAEELLDSLPEDFDLSPGDILAARGIIDFLGQRHSQAISELEQALPLLRYRGRLDFYVVAAETLARAWEALGETEAALRVIEEATTIRPRLFRGRPLWLELQLHLAELYRAIGRRQEALAIEDDVLRYCAFANADFPVLLELRERHSRL